MPPKAKAQSSEESERFRTIRYALEGSLSFVALVGIFGWLYGAHIHELVDVGAAVVGFVCVFAARHFTSLSR